uniref:Methyltransferase n=2 Tax=Streptomyces olivoviridis TaxID=67338 RepID=A0A455VJ84_9ACTN|nr:methyltransferase [Streptomyces olivoviridis]
MTESLNPDTVMYRRPDVLLEIDTSNNCKVHVDGRTLSFGHAAVGLVDVLHRPLTVSEAVRRVRSRTGGQLDTRDVMTDLVGLVHAGVLDTRPRLGFSPRPWPAGGYDSAYVHLRILNDRRRKGAFVAAVRETVRPGDVVLDLGSGSGILAVAAAQAGARKVYAVEPSGMIGLSEAVAEANGVGDRIEFIRDWSTRIELPEKASVLTTDLVGNEPLDMKIWETLTDARQRHLRDDARMVPASFRSTARFYRVPGSYLSAHRGAPADVATWNDWYGIDFSPLVDQDDRAWIGTYERPEVIRDWPTASDEVAVYECDLASDVKPFEVVTAPVDVEAGANAVVLSYRARLGPGTEFDADPRKGGADSHWYTAVWLAGRAAGPVGPRARVEYRYRGDGSSGLHVRRVGGEAQ